VLSRYLTLALMLSTLFLFSAKSAAALTADVAIDYGTSTQAVDPMVYGGNLHYQWHTTFHRDGDALAAIPGHSWRIHWWDNTRDGYRWDTHTIEADGTIIDWHKLDYEENSDGRYSVDIPNTLAVDYWDGTDFNHSLAVTKSPEASNAWMSIRGLSQALPFYLRFDVKIAGNVPFNADGTWYIAYARGTDYNPALRLRLTDAREVSALFYDSNNTTFSVTSAPLTTDTWHAIEVRYGATQCALWIDHSLVGTAVMDLTGKDLQDVYVGSVDSDTTGVEGHIAIDAVRVSDAYVGADVQPPWHQDPTAGGRYWAYLTFDGNMMTVDDICQRAEALGATVIFQIPLSSEPAYGGQPGPPYAWDTIQYWADFVEYINGSADPDYLSKTFDWSHGTPADNWANLRAQRGRVAPYGLEYIEIGNEPYYQEWNWDPPDSFAFYGQKWADMAFAVKQVDPGIRCGLPGRQAWELWEAAIPAILARYPGEELIDWLAVHQYVRILGQADEDQLPWWLGAPVSWRWEERPDSLAGQPWLHTPADAYTAAASYLSGQSNYNDIFVGLTEYNYPVNFPYGLYRNLVDALCKASYIGKAIEENVKMSQVFTLDTEQGHTFGCIADTDSSVVGRELTPSYYAFRLWARYFGSELVAADVTAPTYLFDWSFGANPVWENYRIPYLSLWASRDPAGSTLYVMAVNRHQTASINTFISLSGFVPQPSAAVHALGGAGHTVWSNNETDPENITIQHSQLNNASVNFSYSFEPLSITAIVLTRDGYDPADLDCDGRVDTTDLAILLQPLNWGQSEPQNPKADINADGTVDALDLGVMLSCWLP